MVFPLHDVKRTFSAEGTTPHLHVSTQGSLLAALIVIIYGTVFVGSGRGQTPGMMAMRARAVDASSGAPIGHGRALARALFEYVMVVVLVLPWIVDMLFPLWDSRRQTLHDKVTNTVVVNT